MNQIPQEWVIEQAGLASPLVILDDRVVNLAGFLDHHPGGAAVLIANLGRDVSSDFHHVTAHTRSGVTRKLGQHIVGRIDRPVVPADLKAFPRLLDYVRIVLNSFAVQSDSNWNAMATVVYVGQSYSHLLGDHLPAFLSVLCELTGQSPDPVVMSRLSQIFKAVPGQIDQILAVCDLPAASACSERMLNRSSSLLTNLLATGSRAARLLRTTTLDAPFRGQLEDALTAIHRWIGEEYDSACIVSE